MRALALGIVRGCGGGEAIARVCAMSSFWGADCSAGQPFWRLIIPGPEGYLPGRRRRAAAAVRRAEVQKVTLHDLRRNTYADLFDDDLHTVAVTLDGRYSSENVANGYIRGLGANTETTSARIYGLGEMAAATTRHCHVGECGRPGRIRGVTTATPSYKGHRYPVEIINHCRWLYFRVPAQLP